MGWFNDLLVKVGIKEAPKPKRKYVRKAPAVKKPKGEKKAAAVEKAAGDAQGKMDLSGLPNKDLGSLASRGDGRHPMDSYLNGGGDSHGIR